MKTLSKILKLGLCGIAATIIGCGKYDLLFDGDLKTIAKVKFEGQNIEYKIDKDIFYDDTIVDIFDEKGDLKVEMYSQIDNKSYLSPNLYSQFSDITIHSEYGPIHLSKDSVKYAEFNLLFKRIEKLVKNKNLELTK